MAIGEEAIQVIAKELIQLEEKKHRLAAQATELHKEIMGTKSKLYQSMEDSDVPKITVEDIEFKQAEDINFSLADDVEEKKWDDHPPWFEWLRANDLDGIIKTVVSTNAATRKKTLKEWVEDNKDLPSFAKESYFNTVKYSDAAIKRRALV